MLKNLQLDRLQEVSAENLLLQSNAADHLAEIRDLRFESRELRSRCYDLSEENRQCEAEIRDLRRYIELLKANKPEGISIGQCTDAKHKIIV